MVRMILSDAWGFASAVIGKVFGLFAKKPQDRRVFSDIDYYRLQNILTHQREEAYQVHAKQMKLLRGLLQTGTVCPCKAVPGNLVTMNSILKIRSKRGSLFTLTLVYPRDADPKERKISVLSIRGLELIGKHIGDSFLRNMVISEIVYQPESIGKYYT